MKRPVIAVACRIIENGSLPACFVNRMYMEALQKADGIPVLIPIVNKAQAEEAAQHFDGLMIPGGDDCNPALYGQENTDSHVINADAEQSDLNLYRSFRDAGREILGICRGIQIINVAEGGTLIQDIHKNNDTCLEHSQNRRKPPLEPNAFAHLCYFKPGTFLHSIYSDSWSVNSYHHQCVDRAAEGFTVSARSEDGLVEGIEKNRVTAVQWHPERLTWDEKHMELFRQFVKRCSL